MLVAVPNFLLSAFAPCIQGSASIATHLYSLSDELEPKLMRQMVIVLLAVPVMLILLSGTQAHTSAEPGTTPATASEPPIQSGVYGFSGGKAPGADFPEGVVGECIWIYDQANKNQIAKGECSERNPGKFRVVLKPGRYVVRGPGGTKPIEVKTGQWVNIESITLLPGAL